jgi:hypothetical protein
VKKDFRAVVNGDNTIFTFFWQGHTRDNSVSGTGVVIRVMPEYFRTYMDFT